ncbi:MonoCarboxylate Transporter family [Trichostrongylus colubriformis]|uniref:MonoCarboxylate Transporter family n=1 Tax=Trichostrongylus colubriformis TaxID=6319 RepID=A0AAN8ISP0_TRICO
MTATPSAGKTTRLVPIPPDGGWGWVVVMGTFFIHVVADGFVYSFGVLVDELMREFESDNTITATILSLLTGFTLGSGPLASAVCNKYGCRVTAITGATIAIVGRRSFATGIAVTGAGVGTMVFSPINDYVMSHYGWRAVFLLFIGQQSTWTCNVVCIWRLHAQQLSKFMRIALHLVIFAKSVTVDSLWGRMPPEDVVRRVFSLCVVCASLFRPLPFQEVSEEKGKEEPFTEKMEPNSVSEVTSPLLTSDKPRRSSCDVQADSKSLTMLTPAKADSENVGERDVGYLNRKDIFYTGAITDVREFREDPDKYRSTGSLRRSTISTMSSEILQAIRESPDEVFEDILEDTDNVEGSDVRKTMSNMLFLTLLFDPIFLIFAISNMLSSVGFNSPMYFLPLHAQKGVGLDSAHSSAVLSVFGLSNTIGRIVYGIIADHELPIPYGWGSNVTRNRLWMYNISLSICGLLTAFCFLFTSFLSLSLYAALHGFFLSAYICLASVILVDLLGLDKLTNAFGLLLLWQGVGTVAGPPIAGYLADISGSYNWSFVFSGINLLVSGLMMFYIPYIQKKENFARSSLSM